MQVLYCESVACSGLFNGETEYLKRLRVLKDIYLHTDIVGELPEEVQELRCHLCTMTIKSSVSK